MKNSVSFLFALVLLISTTLFAQGGGYNLKFDGTDDWLNSGTNSINITDSITIEAWVKADDFQLRGYSRILDKYNFFAQEGFNLVTEFPTSGGSVMLDFWATDGSKNSLVGITLITNNQWYYVTAVYDGNAMKIYVNGSPEAQVVIGHKTIRASSNFLAIGNNSDGLTWFPYNGSIEEVRLWNAALDSVTLKDWMHKQLNANHPFSSNLIGYWKFNEGAGSTAADSSGHENNGTLVNMDTTGAWLTSTAPLATGITDTLSQVSAVWISKDSAASSIMSVEDNDIAQDEDVIFGHDNANLTLSTTDVPGGLNIRQRLIRVWRMEVYGQLSADIIFNVWDLDFTDGNKLRLLIDADGVFSDADTAVGTFNLSDSTFIVSNLNLKHGYYYTLGSTENPVSVESNITGIIPEILMLEQNYPNPFNPSTTIEFSIPESGLVTLKVYDLSGSEVTTLVSENLSAGNYKYSWDASDLSSGVYLYQLKLGSFNKTKKLVLLR